MTPTFVADPGDRHLTAVIREPGKPPTETALHAGSGPRTFTLIDGAVLTIRAAAPTGGHCA